MASRASSPSLLGRQLFDIYGFCGLMVGYVIYTIPVAVSAHPQYHGICGQKTLTVSKVMGDKALSTFLDAVAAPAAGDLGRSALSRPSSCALPTFGIPASVGGGYEVIATLLYNQMLGGIPTSTGALSSPWLC
ncbi:MAG: hypothetical protein ACLUJG_07955 [Lawsonibacter sp.]